MRNPVTAAWDYLRGNDLKAIAGPAGSPVGASLPAAPGGYGWLSQPGMQGAFSMLPSDTPHGPDGNSAVFACLLSLAYAHIEPPLKVLRQAGVDANPDWIAASPLQALLDDPNPTHDALEVWFWSQYARHCDGNAYLRKERSGNELTGNVIALWPISPRLMKPITLPGSTNFIDYWEYTYAPGKIEKLPTENVVQFRIGIDDRDMRLGLAPIRRLVREIASDDEATRFADALLHNFGVPGLVVQVPESSPITEDAALAIKARLQSAFGMENRGNVGVLTGGATMEAFGFSPQQMNLEVLHNVPETRIAAVMGVPPAIAGLGVGLAQTSNFASLRQVRENFTEVTLVPTWRMDAAKLNKQLKPEFTPERTMFIQHDLSKVRALQEDMDAQYRRLSGAVAGFWVRPSEARIAVGLPEDTELDALWLNRAAQTGPAALPAAGKSLETKGMDDIEQLPEVFQAMVDAGAAKLQPRLDRYFDDQRKRVKRALLSGG